MGQQLPKYLQNSVFLFFGVLLVGSALSSSGFADEPPIRDRRNHAWRGYYQRNQYRTEDFTCPCPSCNSNKLGRIGISGLGGRPHVDRTMGCRDGRCGRGPDFRANLNQGGCFSSSAFGGSCFGRQYAGGSGCGSPGCPDPYTSTGCGPIRHPRPYRKLRSFNVHWPRPFSPYFDDWFPGECCGHACHQSGNATRRSCGHIFDALDRIANVKVVKRNVRKDNGYQGEDCDPYGKLGISNYPIQHPQKNSRNIAPSALSARRNSSESYYYNQNYRRPSDRRNYVTSNVSRNPYRRRPEYDNQYQEARPSVPRLPSGNSSRYSYQTSTPVAQYRGTPRPQPVYGAASYAASGPRHPISNSTRYSRQPNTRYHQPVAYQNSQRNPSYRSVLESQNSNRTMAAGNAFYQSPNIR